MKRKNKMIKLIQGIMLVAAIVLVTMWSAPSVHAEGEKCAVSSCTGHYENGFCSVCDGYQEAKQVSSTHYSELMSTHEGYYAIENAGQLYWLSDKAESSTSFVIKAVIVKDIVVNKNVLDSEYNLSSNYKDFRPWKPINGNKNIILKYFDGMNHTISGLYLNDNSLNYGGLFGDASRITIKNIGVIDSYFSAGEFCGPIAGHCVYGSKIENCYSDARIDMNVDGYANVAGGIAGYLDTSKVSNCHSKSKITITAGAEGMVGVAAGIIGDSSENTIVNCYNTGDISVKASTCEVGGIVGFQNNYNSVASSITNSYNTGSLSAEGNMIGIGGIVGINTEYCEVKNSFNTGTITYSESAEILCVGGILGVSIDGDVTNCYYNSDNYSGAAVGDDQREENNDTAYGKTTEQFENGEVAYLLNGSTSEGTEDNPLIWYQTTGSDGVPTLDNTHKVVYYEDGRYSNNWPEMSVAYRTHIQTFGWEGTANDIKTWKSNGTMSGTSGKSKRLEGINIVVTPNTADESLDLGIQYTTHCQSYGWLPWSANGEMNGTEGEAKRLEAIMIKLTGKNAKDYDVYYRVHAQTYGWLGWASNGAPAGTAGFAKRLEGIQIVVVKKGESFNQKMGDITSARTEAFVAKEGNSPIVNYPATSNTNPVVPGADTVNVAYRTHVQSFGWQGWKYNGQMSGTSGKSKRLEGINIELRNKDCSGDIVYTTHVQKYGWQGKLEDQSTWKKNGEMAGTSGEAKRLEAICINLTGEMCQKYDIYYRVHAQSYGWLGWAKNGAPAGTAGYAKRLEGIQVVLVPKGGAAPTSHDGITSARAEAYIKK
ncbi:MAG: hypothetical protein E7257_09460 [Lachnospiraceae bacterium]|nr:hypothetical protein [Lachnospiraceae bacterium]